MLKGLLVLFANNSRFYLLLESSQKSWPEKTHNGTIVLDSLVRVCCALNNVCEGIVPFN